MAKTAPRKFDALAGLYRGKAWSVPALRRREFWRAKCHMRRIKKAKDALEALRKNYPSNATYEYRGPGINAFGSDKVGTLFDEWERALKYRLSFAADRCKKARMRCKVASITQDEIKASNQRKDSLANYVLDIEDTTVTRTLDHIIVIGP